MPTQQEVSAYFFGTANAETTRKVEQWFFEHGKSPEAGRLLYCIWEELEPESAAKEEVRQAFEEFRNRLTGVQQKPHLPNRPAAKVKWVTWMQRVAAILLLPVILFTIYQYMQVKEEKSVMWVEKSVAYGRTDSIALPDGTLVWMNAGSKIIYPEKFTARNRQVFFTGEAYFTVMHNRRKPFVVQSNEINVQVLGTEFNLKSYSEDKIIEVSLLEGSVSFHGNMARNENISYVMEPGEQVFYDREKISLWKNRFATRQYSSWKEGKLSFRDVSLGNIARQLERNFDLKIIIKTDSLKDIRYYMDFVNNETPDQILEALSTRGQMNVKRTGQFVEIY